MNKNKRNRLLLKSCLLLALLGIVTQETLWAQQRVGISINVKDKPLDEVLEQIETENGYRFLYSADAVDVKRKITANFQNASLESVLQKILDEQVHFTISNRQVIIYNANEKPTAKPQPTTKSAKIVVEGFVKNNLGEPLLGVSVIEVGTYNGDVSNVDGHYSISISANKESVLSFSYLGYKTKQCKVNFNTKLDVVLDDDDTKLEDVVVIGYGTQSRVSVTGALSTIDSKELTRAPVASITNVLSGAIPGVSTVQSSGQPGADAAAIYVRGAGSLSTSSSSPLILVDGVERDFSQIDPNEIANFSVLKDASSTAVFGIRGANGVILITTKRGNDDKLSISVSSNTGIQQPLSYVQQTGSYEYARFWNMKQSNDGITDKSQYFTREAIETYRTGADPIMYPNVKWADQMFNKVFLQTKNNINISGGGNRVRYFMSFGYLYQNGMLKQSGYLPYDNNYKYERYNYRANIDFDITKTTTMKFNVGGMVGTTQEPNSIVDENEWVYATIWAVPMSGPGFINGKRTLVPTGFVPKVELRDGYSTFYGYGYNQYARTTLNIDAEIIQQLDFMVKGLSLSVKGAYDNIFSLNKYRTGNGAEFQRAYYKSYLADKTTPPTNPDYDKTIVYVPEGSDTPLTYNETYDRDRNWYIEAKLNYSHSFGEHRVSAMLLYNQSRDYYPTYSNGLSAAYQYIPRGYIGFVGRATYSYLNRYLLDVNMGYNGSENFAPGSTRYGLFPSASIGWVISEEGFMRNQNIIDYLKVRLSRGLVGNDRSNSRFMYVPSVWSASGSYSFGINNPTDQTAFVHSVPGNMQVSWETADKQNYGLDMNLLRNRLSFSFDYFTEHRTGILMSPNSTPAIIATTSPALNIGVVDNHGYEIALGWNDKTDRNFHYYINANVSFARNKIIYMDEVKSEYAYQNQTGGSTERYTGVYQFERLYQYSDFNKDANGNLVLNPSLPTPAVNVYPGDAMYADLNGDRQVNSDDKMVTGYASRPEYIFGLNTGFDWNGFNFSMQWTGATHVSKMMQIEYRIPYTNAGMRGLLQYFYDDCWTEDHQSGTLPRAAETSEGWNSENSTLWLKDAKYLRLKTISAGYTISGKRWIKSLGIQSVAITLSGYNLLTFTPLHIMDPESLADNNGGYPLAKVYSLGVNITF